MRRRDFLKRTGRALVGGCAALSPFAAGRAQPAPTLPIDDLARRFDRVDGEIVTRSRAADYARLTTFYNKRFDCVMPQAVVRCASAQGVAKALRWCHEHDVPFALRSGGHCYEGLSRSRGVIIDVRGLDAIDFRSADRVLRVGSGVNLGSIYRMIAGAGQMLPAGTCPAVGIAGHATAGGIGYFARPFGLACDNLMAAELVTADGSLLTADAAGNPDLLWALRGAGPGSFGIITRMDFRTREVRQAHVYRVEVIASKSAAARFMAAWQVFAEGAPREATNVVFLKKEPRERIRLEIKGLIVGSAGTSARNLSTLMRELDSGTRLRLERKNALQAFEWFSEGEDLPPTYEKGKSDIVKKAWRESDWRFLLDHLPVGVDAEFTALGGALNDLTWDQTAFPHRGDARLLIQWGIAWKRPADAARSLATIDDFYAHLRPLMSSAAFLNYADRDLPDPARAYWAGNLERLTEVKRRYDPQNVFRHALSVPLHTGEAMPRADTCS